MRTKTTSFQLWMHSRPNRRARGKSGAASASAMTKKRGSASSSAMIHLVARHSSLGARGKNHGGENGKDKRCEEKNDLPPRQEESASRNHDRCLSGQLRGPGEL